jgi:hypothetical protein
MTDASLAFGAFMLDAARGRLLREGRAVGLGPRALMDEAHRQLAELRRLEPHVTVASTRAGQCAKDPARIEPVLAGLRLAGLPEE